MLRDWWFARRLTRLAQSSEDVLRDYGTAAWPGRGEPAASASFLCLDFELDGLEQGAHILQAGWIALGRCAICLGTARSMDVRSERRLDDTAVTVHGIGENRARAGEPLELVLCDLVRALSGRVLVAHGAAIELRSLSAAARAVWSVDLPLRGVCTMALERKLHPGLVAPGAYRLGASRARYNLPEHDAHDALSDALAAGELFLAQLAHLPADTRLATLEDCRIDH